MLLFWVLDHLVRIVVAAGDFNTNNPSLVSFARQRTKERHHAADDGHRQLGGGDGTAGDSDGVAGARRVGAGLARAGHVLRHVQAAGAARQDGRSRVDHQRLLSVRRADRQRRRSRCKRPSYSS